VEAWGDVVFEEGDDEFFGEFVVVVAVVVLVVMAVAAVRDVSEGAVRRDEERVVVLGVLEQLLDIVVLFDQLGESGRVVALLDQLVDCLFGVATVSVAAMPAMSAVRGGSVILFLLAIDQAKQPIQGAPLDALGDAVLNGGEETFGVRKGIPPSLDCILFRRLLLEVKERDLLLFDFRGNESGNGSRE
jgi:hypothetical protein